MFPSPRGVELHKPSQSIAYSRDQNILKFPSPRGVELHKPMISVMILPILALSFRPLAGLSCINHRYLEGRNDFEEAVSVPSRG